MFALQDSDGIQPGGVVAIGMDWGEYAKPSLADLQAMWPEFDVAVFANVPVSNALVRVNRFITVNALLMPVRKHGVKRVIAFRMEKQIPDPLSELGEAVTKDLEKLHRVLFAPIRNGNGEPDPWGSAKTFAITIGVVAGIAGVGLVVVHYMRKRKK